MSSLVQSVGPSSRSAPRAGDIGHSLPISPHEQQQLSALPVALYLYPAGARLGAVTLPNYPGLSVLYNMLLRKPRGKSLSSQSPNRRPVGRLDNFEDPENVNGERVCNTVKFCPVTIMALWIKSGWSVAFSGLNKSMWDPTRGLLRMSEMILNTLKHDEKGFEYKSVRLHRFETFQAVFPEEPILGLAIQHTNMICRQERRWRARQCRISMRLTTNVTVALKHIAFASSTHNESSLASKIGVLDDLNIVQMGTEQK